MSVHTPCACHHYSGDIGTPSDLLRHFEKPIVGSGSVCRVHLTKVLGISDVMNACLSVKLAAIVLTSHWEANLHKAYTFLQILCMDYNSSLTCWVMLYALPTIKSNEFGIYASQQRYLQNYKIRQQIESNR